jgi:hypothetical protein
MSNGMIPFMDFKHADFDLTKVNTTVRLGDKWAGLSLGQKLVVGSTKTCKAYQARVVGIKLLQWHEITDADLSLEHVEKARTKAGLKDILQNCYGFAELDETSPWTVVLFSIVPETVDENKEQSTI